MKVQNIISGFFIIAIAACKTQENTTKIIQEPSGDKKKSETESVYRASNTRMNDLLHMELRLSLDWENKYLFGEAVLTLKPYFYSQDSLYLNARGMEIKEVSLVNAGKNIPLNYKYESDSLKIKLDKTYSREEQYSIFIDYVSKPEELPSLGGSAAITSDKGLYFINAAGADKNKPRQLWTQGETQSGSVWFPTIDSPNERMTQEIYITVDTSFVTLSNGVLLSSVINHKEGYRTDYWKQTVPAAPYLTMLAISNFKIVKDKWHNTEVSYYVDPEYERYAKNIFGNTPEMMEFFSKKLDVDFPWEKYAQVVVHDYVSGAMENASATLHGEFMQRDARALLDESNESVISHELSHQWFGDLVTCESWSHIPLNESFATYAEYLWNEYKYGRDESDYYLMKDLDRYLQYSKQKNENLIRFYYNHREDVFDPISYQKGGRILHMLRKYAGDEAFFKSLNLYLTANRLKAVETHHLRLAFEEITGKDLNWFFNQWFFDKGHPDLNISYAYNEQEKRQTVIIEQKQDQETAPIFKVPMAVDVYANGMVTRHNIWLTQKRDTFSFMVPAKPDLVNVDAEKMLVCTKTDNHTAAEWIFQYRHAPLFLDRYEAIQKIGRKSDKESGAEEIIKMALSDSSWAIRLLAIKKTESIMKQDDAALKMLLTKMVKNDPKSAVRASALAFIGKHYSGADLTELFLTAANDSSYDVMAQALQNLIKTDKEKGMAAVAKIAGGSNSNNTRSIVSEIYAEEGGNEHLDFILNSLQQAGGEEKYTLTLALGTFLSRNSPGTAEKGVTELVNIAKNNNAWYIRLGGMQALNELSMSFKSKAKELSKKNSSSEEVKKFTMLAATIDKEMNLIKKQETNPNLQKIYGTGENSSN